MHPISDKELDKLFQQKFESVEFQPSADLWGKIADQMDKRPEKKKRFPILWMAASILVTVSVGFWFYRPVNVIRLHGKSGQMAMRVEQPETAETTISSETLNTSPLPVINSSPAYRSVPVQQPVNVAVEPEDIIERQVDEPVMARTSIRKNPPAENISKPDVKAPERYYGDQSQLDVTQADMVASAETDEVTDTYSPQTKPSRRIKSIGGLVNYVIAKVDRRDDKLIEFKDSEEGSEVSGINLGLLKLKNRNK